jgi:hypothetical protein
VKYFIDTEFIEDGKTIELISLGAVCEDGRTFYAENVDVDWPKANPWVVENVMPHLWNNPDTTGTKTWIAEQFLKFVGDHGSRFEHAEKPEFWGYYADYDWVVICQLYGTMMDLPRGWPMYCHDIKQYCDDLGNPQLPEQLSTKHNALDDAIWNKHAYAFLRSHHLGMMATDKTEVQ